MTIRQLSKKQSKLWQKFWANFFYFKAGSQRRLIKIFKGFWFLVLTPVELISDLIFRRQRPLALDLPPAPKILIIKIDQLGDVLFSTRLLPALKAKWPESQIDYLINPASRAILEGNSQIRALKFWSSSLLANIPGRQKYSLASRWQSFKTAQKQNRQAKLELLSENYDLVINARAFWPSSNRLARRLGKKLIAFDISQFSNRADIVVPYNLKAWEEDNYKGILSALGLCQELINAGEARGQFFNFSDLPLQALDQTKLPYWVLSPISFDPEKTWTPLAWAEFIKLWLRRQPALRLAISCLEESGASLEKIKDELKKNPADLARINFISNLNISQLATLINNSQGYIGLESFPAHLAIALKKPAYCLVNSRLFYVPELSQQKFVDGRSMLPKLAGVNIYDVKKTRPEILAARIKA